MRWSKAASAVTLPESPSLVETPTTTGRPPRNILLAASVTGVELTDLPTGRTAPLACDGVFVSVGRLPATDLVRGQLALDAAGYIAADETTRTSLPGVYAVGDVRTKALRQVVTAAADGANAVHAAEAFLAENP